MRRGLRSRNSPSPTTSHATSLPEPEVVQDSAGVFRHDYAAPFRRGVGRRTLLVARVYVRHAWPLASTLRFAKNRRHTSQYPRPACDCTTELMSSTELKQQDAGPGQGPASPTVATPGISGPRDKTEQRQGAAPSQTDHPRASQPSAPSARPPASASPKSSPSGTSKPNSADPTPRVNRSPGEAALQWMRNRCEDAVRPLVNIIGPQGAKSPREGLSPSNAGGHRSTILENFGISGGSPALFPAEGARGLLAPSLQRHPSSDLTVGEQKKHPWSLKNWKRFSLDMYVRIVEKPSEARLRVKQTIAVLPFLKLKPCVDMSFDPSWTAPVRMRLDVKMFDFFKYRVLPDGSSMIQVRARAPLADPRLLVDVVYDRALSTGTDSVRVTLRGLDLVFFKAPQLGAGCKVPVQFANWLKSTIRVKKYVHDSSDDIKEFGTASMGRTRRRQNAQPDRSHTDRRPWFDRRPSQDHGRGGSRGATRNPNRDEDGRRWRLHGPAGVDVKLRLWELGSTAADVQDSTARSS